MGVRLGSLPNSSRSGPSVADNISLDAVGNPMRSPVNGSLQIRKGSFSVALVGGMLSSAAGATYVLEATVNLSDGRVLKLNATLECQSPGA